MMRVCRVGRAVKIAVGAAETALEHLKHLFVPGGHLIAIGILNGHALDPCHVLPVVRAQDMHPPPEELRRVVRADVAHQPLAPDVPHGFQDVASQRTLGVAQHHRCPLSTEGAEPLRDDHRIVQPALAAAGGADLQVPPVVAVGQIFPLFSR